MNQDSISNIIYNFTTKALFNISNTISQPCKVRKKISDKFDSGVSTMFRSYLSRKLFSFFDGKRNKKEKYQSYAHHVITVGYNPSS